jgi:ATP-dependent DNA helicase RecG
LKVEFVNNNELLGKILYALAGFTRQQARSTLDRMRKEKILVLNKKGKYSSYSLIDENK